MDAELARLIEEIEAYLVATGMPPTRFGKLAVKDGAAVLRIRRGRPITTRIMSAMRQFMAENPPWIDQEQEQEHHNGTTEITEG